MIIDNSKFLKKFIQELKNPDDFIFVQIIQRKKDGIKLPSYTSGARTIKSFYFFTLERFEFEWDYIKEICDTNNARAYFWVNPRNSNQIAFECAKNYISLVQENRAYQGFRVWDHQCGKCLNSNYDNLWIVDFDTKDEEIINKYIQIIKECRGSKDRFKYKLETVHGWHWLVTGFDREQFYQKLALYQLPSVDIHLNSPSILYCNVH